MGIKGKRGRCSSTQQPPPPPLHVPGVYDGMKNSDRPRTLIFRVLRWHDRLEILKGARQAYPVKCAQDNVTLLFFPDFSPATSIRRKAFNPVLKKMTSLGLQPFLTYLAVINYGTKGSRRCSTLLKKRSILSAPCLSRRRMPRLYGKAMGKQRPLSLRPGGRGLMAGMEAVLAAQEGMMAGWTGMLAEPVFLLFLLSSLLLGYCPYLSGTTISLLVRLTPFFLFWRGLMESRFHYNFFGAV